MARKGSGAKVKTRVIKQAAPKSAGTSVVVVEPSAPAAPKRRGGGRRRKAAAPARRRRGGRRGGARYARARGFLAAGGRHAVSSWQASQPQLLTVAAAGAVGLLQKQGIKVPKLINSLSTPANIGLMAWVAARFLKSPILDHAATGMLSVAAFGLGSGVEVGEDVGYTTMGAAVAYDDVSGYNTMGDYADGDETDGEDDV